MKSDVMKVVRVLVFTGGLVLTGLGLFLVVRPARFEAIARVRPESLLGAAPAEGGSYDPYFMQRQFEFLVSAEVLGETVQRLQARRLGSKAWTTLARHPPDDLAKLLKSNLSLQPIRGTSLIAIAAWAKDPELAAAMANALAEAYRDQSARRWESNQVHFKAVWRRGLETHPELKAAHERMARLVRDLNVTAEEYYWVRIADVARPTERADELAPLVAAEREFTRQWEAVAGRGDSFIREFNDLLLLASIASPDAADPVIPAVRLISAAPPPGKPMPSRRALGAGLVGLGLVGNWAGWRGMMRRRRGKA